MKGQKHIIQREILELTVPDRDRALPLQNKVSGLVKYKLNPALDKLFSKISKPDEVVSIDRLVIDLGNIQPDKFDDDFIGLAVKRAEDQLTKLILNKKIEEQTGSLSTPFGKKSLWPPLGKGESGNVNINSLQDNYLQRFINFLETGNLSWWKSTDVENPLDAIISHLNKIDRDILQEQLLPLLKQPQVRKRLAYQFNDDQLKELLCTISEREVEKDLEFFQTFKPIFSRSKLNAFRFRNAFWETSIELISENKTTKTDLQRISFLKTILFESIKPDKAGVQESMLLDILQHIISGVSKGIDKNISLLVAAVLSVSYDLKLNSEKLISTLKKLRLEKDHFLRKYIKQVEKEIESARHKPEITDQRIKIPKKEKAETTTSKESDQKESDLIKPSKKLFEANDIFINNAGLVILHPYLKYFFDGLNLLDKEEQFKSLDHAFKAVHLLQFIVTKTQESPEYELSLNKIICGLDIEETIPQEAFLTTEEMEECENLLLVILDRWAALKTKNTVALIETYLKREGILSSGNQGWNLHIERNTFDVMLDKLPWSISIIKFPWNPQILYVEW